jgi:hypothetical protein
MLSASSATIASALRRMPSRSPADCVRPSSASSHLKPGSPAAFAPRPARVAHRYLHRRRDQERQRRIARGQPIDLLARKPRRQVGDARERPQQRRTKAVDLTGAPSERADQQGVVPVPLGERRHECHCVGQRARGLGRGRPRALAPRRDQRRRPRLVEITLGGAIRDGRVTPDGRRPRLRRAGFAVPMRRAPPRRIALRRDTGS